jgi:predicted ArsR family transcriptional regulator
VPAGEPGQAGRRRDVLRELRAAPGPVGIAELADRLGVHPNTVRFHLTSLLRAGQVERVEADPGGPGRPPQLFRPVRGMDPAGPRRYQLMAEILADQLAAGPEPAARAVEAGRTWARRLAAPTTAAAGPEAGAPDAVARLVGLLDDLGFAPEAPTADPTGPGDAGGPVRIGLRNCPFLALAEARQEVVCPVHLGLMRGALEAWGAPVTVARLEPFVAADLCVAHVAREGAR